jgi:high-affinity nickel-transport protein
MVPRLTRSEKRRAGGMAGFILALHLVGWFVLVALVAPKHYPLLGIGIGVTAYTLGMRHAFDADHIAAIDNTTRKLMSEGKRPLSVGFFFSLGHSSVVFLLSLLLSVGIRAVEGQVHQPSSALHNVAGVVGTLVSGGFLYIIAALNLVILLGIVKVFRDSRSGHLDEEALEAKLEARGFMTRFFGRLMKSIRSPWQMYPVGFLFGLGFDTATEIALLSLAATAAGAHLPFYAILCLPILFAAGMSLLDTIDGSFMNFAYGWAFSNPLRKIFYNVTITALSVGVALIIGTVELASVIAQQFKLTGGVWGWTARFNINSAGFFIVGLFVVTWVVAIAVWKFGRFEQRWASPRSRPAEGEPSRSEPTELEPAQLVP